MFRSTARRVHGRIEYSIGPDTDIIIMSRIVLIALVACICSGNT